jgi:hypothetical protein
MHRLLISLIFFVLTGCALHLTTDGAYVNPDSWHFLSLEEKARFHAFKGERVAGYRPTYQHITAENVRHSISKSPFSWIILVENCCSAYPSSLKTEWLPLSDSLSKTFPLQTYVVFDTYQLRFLDIYEHDCRPQAPSFVIDYARYGNNFRKKTKRFLRELVPEYRYKNSGTVHILLNAEGKCVFADEESLFRPDSVGKRAYIKRSLITAIH